MKPIFNSTIGAYYNNRAFEIALAVKYLGTDHMSNGYDEISYGQSASGHLIINIHRRRNGVNIIFMDNYMEMYHANGHGYVTCHNSYARFEYSLLDAYQNIEKAREFIWLNIRTMLNYNVDDNMIAAEVLNHVATAVYNAEWNGRVNRNVEQIRECANFITDLNLGYGQAFYGYNNMGRLIVWIKHHPSINKFDLPDEHRDNSIIVEFQGDGIAVIYNSDEFGMPKDDDYRGLIDDHWDSVRGGKQHAYFVKKAKDDCGVYLV